jgi:lysylphosphatidylglycerol synthetase-like protein (DUF2156 family)
MTTDDLRQPSFKNPVIRHILYPAITSVLFFAVAATPVEALGCRTRGLLAFAIALLSVLAGVGAAVMALRGRLRGDRHSHWWAASALVLAIPAVALIILA